MSRIISILLSVTGGILATAAAGAFTAQQANISGSDIFPMPFLALLDWGILGIAGAVYIILAELRSEPRQLQGAWGILGAYIPLILLGALTIGPLALVSAAFLLVAAMILTVRYKAPYLRQLGFLVIGGLVNLVILIALILLARVSG